MTVFQSRILYKKDSNGATRTWQSFTDGGKCWRTVAGGDGRKDVWSGWTTCKGKQGRSDEEQALFEAQAAFDQKLAREYRLTVAELSSVPKGPMLAKDFADHKDKLNFEHGVFCQPKLDGIRALVSEHGAFTREYQPHLNVEHIMEALKPAFEAYPGIQFDGELYNHDFKDDFGRISSIVRKQNPTPEQRAEAAKFLQFHIYDVADDSMPFADRNWLLFQTIFGESTIPVIVPVVTHKVAGAAELDERNGEYLSAGYEGQMVRTNMPYEFDKRSKTLLKRKEFITEEFDLVRIEEGNGNWAGFAKRVVFSVPWATPDHITGGAECGAGIRGTQAQMKELLARKITPGSTVTVRHFNTTPDGMPRFPVAIDFHFGGRKD